MKVFGTVALSIAANVVTLGGPAMAATPNPANPAGDDVSEVVVTGSRVIANGNNSPTPVTVVSAEDLLTLHPTTVAEGLNDLPAFAGSRGAASNPGFGGTNPAGSNNAAAVMNLRGLGLLRTLILYDGKRVPPSTPEGYVDVNMVPQMLLQRVDVVTGGASAVYGSDAVSGVVNFITDTKFTGLKADVQGGSSTYSDDRTIAGGIAFGTNLFDGRGHFMGSFQNRHDPGIDRRTSREWGRKTLTLQGNGTTAFPYILVENARVNNATFGGRINNGVLANQQFTGPGGFLTPFVSGSRAGVQNATIDLGGDGAFHDSSFKAMLDMNQLYGRVDFDFTENLHGYLTSAGSLNHTSAYNNYQVLANTVIGAQNAFLQPQYQARLATAGQASFTFGKFFTGLPRLNTDTFARQHFINTGVTGGLGDGYKWDVSYTNSKTGFDVRSNANFDQGRLYAALDSVVNPANGQAVCRVTITNPTLYPGCVPINVFGVNSESKAAIDYVLGVTRVKTTTGLDDFAGSITGAPVSTWAGPVNMALSAEWRRLSYEIESNQLPTERANCTGILFNCTATTTRWQGTVGARSEVTQTVSEGAIEFGVPLLKDRPFAQSIDLNVAYRFTHYDTSGNANTWKAGMTWDLLDQVTFRATRSRDIRAPNMDELFRPTTVNQIAFQDLLTNTQAPVPTQFGGNLNLTPEIADTTTFGVVYRPSETLSFALDAFNIRIKDAILLIQGNNPTIQAACYASNGASPYCALQERPLGFTNTSAANAPTKWYQIFFNIAQQKTYGADFEANYRMSVFDRPLSLRGLVTYQPHLKFEQPGLPTNDMGGVAFGGGGLQASPKWRATAFVTYKPVDSLTVSVLERWRSSLKFLGTPAVVASEDIASVAYTNLTVSYAPTLATGKVDFYMNVQNVFNKQPPPAAFFGVAGSPGSFGDFAFGDDPVGRYYTAGVHYRF